MQYPSFRDQHQSITSGALEASAKHLVHETRRLLPRRSSAIV
jgi:hypothetical protein